MTMTSGLTLGQVFGRTMQLFKEGIGKVFVGIVLPLGLTSGLVAAGIASFQTDPDAMVRYGVPVTMLALFGVVLLAVCVGVVGAGALGFASVNIAAGRDVSVSEAWRQGVRFRVWATSILSGIGVVLGLMCCLLPGMYLMLAWCLALPIIFEESVFYSTALGRSNTLMQFNPQGGIGNDPRFRMFLIGVAAFATMYIIQGLIQLPLLITTIVTVARQTANGGAGTAPEIPAIIHWLQIPTSIAGSLIQSLTIFMTNLGACVLYFDIRGRQEASDIAAAIDGIGTKPNA